MNIENLADHGYTGINGGTKIHHFLQGIKSTELHTAHKVVWTKTEKYGKDFYAMVSDHGQIIMKKGYNLQTVHIASQPAKPKLTPLMAKIKCKVPHGSLKFYV